jgi:hypothetical protein
VDLGLQEALFFQFFLDFLEGKVGFFVFVGNGPGLFRRVGFFRAGTPGGGGFSGLRGTGGLGAGGLGFRGGFSGFYTLFFF